MSRPSDSRPTDIWRVCGQPVTTSERPDQKGRGCRCSGGELFNDTTLLAALARLSPVTPASPPTDDSPSPPAPRA
jgi:hypothetical protein